jgi:hypothetical protein
LDQGRVIFFIRPLFLVRVEGKRDAGVVTATPLNSIGLAMGVYNICTTETLFLDDCDGRCDSKKESELEWVPVRG